MSKRIPHRDRNDKPVQVGSRCRRYLREDTALSGKVMVTAIHEDGRTVDYESIKNMTQGTTTLDLLEVLQTGKGRKAPASVLRYQLDKEAVRLASAASKKRKRGQRR